MTALAWVEHALPGGPDERLALARELDLALELACRGGDVPDPRGLPVVCVQAWDLHREHPLHRDAAARERAREHVQRALQHAERLGAARVLAVCGFGSELVDAPFERALEFFAGLASEARERGRRIVLEPLSPGRAAALTDLDEFARLLAALPADVFGLALDTGHLLDGGRDPARVLAAPPAPVEELQLRGRSGAPPASDEAAGWLRTPGLRPRTLVVEHAPGIAAAEVAALTAALRRSQA